MTDFYIATGTRRDVYHADPECIGLKRANDYMSKSYEIIKRMRLGPCKECLEDECSNQESD